MATMTKAPEYYGWYWNRNPNFSGWQPWSPDATVAAYKSTTGLNYMEALFLAELPTAGTSFTSVTAEMSLKNMRGQNVPGGSDATPVRVTVYAGDVSAGVELGYQEFTVEGEPGTMEPVSHRFSFSGLSGSGESVSVRVEVLDLNTEVEISTVTMSINYTIPAMELNLTPTTVYVGHNVSLQILNRYSRTVTAAFWYNDTLLESRTVTADTVSIPCPASWFETAAYTGSSMRVTVRIADDLGRTANGNFTLLKPEGSAATPIAPRSTRLDGAAPINFSWQTADTWGAQTKAELQWSADNAVWEDLATVDGSGTTWTAPAVKFPAGTIYWRVRATNEYFEVGPWSNGVSFTVEYAATSQVEPIDSPTSGVINAAVARTFSVILRASGAVYAPFLVDTATFYWRDRSSGPYNELPMTPDGSRASVLIPANTFPVGTVQWYAEATDTTGNTTVTETYTLSTLTTAVQAVPLSPIDTVESGSGEIVFRWFYGSIDGSPQGAAEIQTSADGEAWETLATVTGAGAREYTAAAYTFEAGAVYWRIRAKTETGDYGPWSEAVSFVCYSAPLVDGVMADGAPWATITWQTSGQLAYEIEVDGESVGIFFGAEDRAFTLLEPLADGTHSVRVRAQNKYSLWSEWAEAIFYVENGAAAPTITLRAEAGEDAVLSWTGGSSVTPPRITVQPVDMATIGGYVSFAVKAEGAGLRYQWYRQAAGSSEWISLGEAGNRQTLTLDANADLDGSKFRCVVTNAAGSDTSDAAVYSYENPTALPTITVQPETVTKNTGTAEFVCGANGSVYSWYHKTVDTSGSESDVRVTDGAGGLWRIPYGSAEAGAIPVTDGSNSWNIPQGAGSAGDIAVEDGAGGTWHMPAGSGTAEEWEPMGVFEPVLSFPADQARDGEQFFCRVYNAVGYADSDVVQYIYGEEPEEAIPGDYYVFRDGELIARRTEPGYTDRTALGEHTYRVVNRLDNNRYIYSNTVTVTITVGCLMIAPLAGGAWQRLRLSDREDRAFRFNRTRKVAYVHYSGSRYPEAEVGEEEDLTGGFDVSWRYENRDEADAFEALIGEQVVLKTPRDVVMTGVLQGFERDDPRFFKAYTFELRQDDWRPMEDA